VIKGESRAGHRHGQRCRQRCDRDGERDRGAEARDMTCSRARALCRELGQCAANVTCYRVSLGAFEVGRV
jgi:hypothetical protein